MTGQMIACPAGWSGVPGVRAAADLRSGLAVTVVIVWATLVFVGLLEVFGCPLANGLTHRSHRLPVYIQDAAQGHGWIGHLVRRFHPTAWVERNAPNLQTPGSKLAQPALSLGKGAASVLAELGPSPRWSCCSCLKAPRCGRDCWA